MSVTVIIPTYNRAAILEKTLEAYGRQIGDHRICEILVVDDGSTDDTQTVVERSAKACPLVRYLKQPNRGLAAARNHGIREAVGDLLLFGDDDIIPSPQLTSEHVKWQDKHPEGNCGVLGHVGWWPEVRPTPFMRWAGLYGPQFNFGYFKPGQQLSYEVAYFCNTSVPAACLREGGIFNENFRTYGYEDIELSYRLTKKGYRCFYNPDAIGYHNKFERCADTLRRVNQLYASWPEFAKTEAGQDVFKKWRSRNSRSDRGLARKALRPLKPLALLLLKPLIDSYVPLPGWIYNQIFYSCVTPFADFVAESMEAASV